ncbi:hypothetical protein V6N11_084192 [Hibiscus sabdariffa]|uniref:Uncharacterized protein n=1 Tax=Hibiscus sabdariffa TaxID=183260 RepID=A0ABR2QS99_9ROSI
MSLCERSFGLDSIWLMDSRLIHAMDIQNRVFCFLFFTLFVIWSRRSRSNHSHSELRKDVLNFPYDETKKIVHGNTILTEKDILR